MSGSESDSGIVSAIASCRTYRERKTVRPIPTLLPSSQGRKYEKRVRKHRTSTGTSTVYE